MENQEQQNQEQEEKKVSHSEPSSKRYLINIALVIGIFIALGGIGVTISETYHRDKIFHGVQIGHLDVGGLKKEQAMDILTTWHDQWWSNELQYQVLDESNKQITRIEFFPIIVSEEAGQSQEIIHYDLNEMLERAYSYGRDSSLFVRVGNQLALLFSPKTIQPVVSVDEIQLKEVLRTELEEYETKPINAGFEVSTGTAKPVLISEAKGNTFNYATAVAETVDMVWGMQSETLTIQRSVQDPAIYTEDVQQALEQFEGMKELFPTTVTYFDPKIDFPREWNVSLDEVLPLFGVVLTDEGNPQIGLTTENEEESAQFFSQFESLVNSEALNAKFSVGEGGKVEQFQPSQKGYTVDHEQTLIQFNAWMQAQLSKPETDTEEEGVEPEYAKLAVQIIEPEIPTGEVNDLGITEVLGVGYSDFSGSPRNRIHNIGVGAEKLNGLLIAPEEEFSLLSALRPFTIAGGYLPELVIKGDKIEPEIGGGLCQIGSTTFRAAMKSGLPIVERRNHSLVVSYYNDPRNGNPGTDATIYDPAPDFKFKNDTGNYILIETQMDASTGDLFFTFWGTSDGREGDYTEPVVHRWIGTGPTKNVETTDLAPGEKKCQYAHVGAETSFTYTVTRPNGEVEEEEFFSSYRPLPTICLVGVDPNAPAEGEEVADPESDPVSDGETTVQESQEAESVDEAV